MLKRTAAALCLALLASVALPWGAAASEPPADENKGCCSHHGGVCGCSGGRAVCCDQTISRTCGC